jgi:hypothetical protein
MAVESNVTAASHVFLGEDKVLEFTITDEDDVPVDVSGWAMIWDLRKADKTTGDALIEKTTGAGITVTGVYNVAPLVNTQRVLVTLADTDSDSSTTIQAKTYRHALKRSDDGSETVLAFGDFTFLQATTR